MTGKKPLPHDSGFFIPGSPTLPDFLSSLSHRRVCSFIFL